jgi:hypothetical protein
MFKKKYFLLSKSLSKLTHILFWLYLIAIMTTQLIQSAENNSEATSTESETIEFSEKQFKQKLIYFAFLVTSSKYLGLPYPIKRKVSLS